jgi:hypothetical protein
LGTNIGDEQPAKVESYVLNSRVKAAGDLILSADNSAQLNATASNESTSNASALVNATGKSVSALLASNLVSSYARAYIYYTTATLGTQNIEASSITITSQDRAGLDANTKMLSSSTTTNQGGQDLLGATAGTLLDGYQFTTKSGEQELNASDFQYTALADGIQSTAVKKGDRVWLSLDYSAGVRWVLMRRWI